MGTRRERLKTPKYFAVWLGLCLALTADDPRAFAEELNAATALTNLRASLAFPKEASITFTVEAKGTWHNVSGAETDPYTREVVDEWLVMSDQSLIGRERYRESADGSTRVRHVIKDGRERRVFEFDTSAPTDAEVVGRLLERNQLVRGPNWHMPISDYMDRTFTADIGTEMYTLLEIADDTVLVDGHACNQIRGQVSGREFTLWLDPAFGCLPREYTLQLNYAQMGRNQRRGRFGLVDQRLVAPPAMRGQLDRPLFSEERLHSVVLDTVDGKHFISQAILEKTQRYAGDISYTEVLSMKASNFAAVEAPEAKAFLDFEGLLRDGTPVEERIGGWTEEETITHFVMENGRRVPAEVPLASYFEELGSDLERLFDEFTIENLQRIDSKFLVAVCAVAALLINGGIAYAGHRRKRSKAS